MRSDATAITRGTWRAVTWVTAAFLLLVGSALVWSDLRIRQDDPLKSVRLKNYKEQLRSNPADEQLKAQIRQLDLELRNRYFQHLSQKNSGVLILIAGTVLFVVASQRAAIRSIFMPAPKDESQPGRDQAWSRATVALIALAGGVTLCVAGLSLKSPVPRRNADMAAFFTEPTDASSNSDNRFVEEARRNWPRFRGPDGTGSGSFSNVPPSWGRGTGHEVLWKSPLPVSGYNSPIVWGNRLFLSGVTETECMVYCFDAETGQVLWHESISGAAAAFKSESQAPAVSCANATMTVDGERAFAFFGSGDLLCLSLDGKPVWSKKLGPLKNPYGHASSLLTSAGKLILQLDQGEAESSLSKLFAFEARTGRVIWERSRRVGSSWATPLVIHAGGRAQIITEAVPAVISYALDTGAEVWRVQGLNNEVTPSPSSSGSIVFAVSPSEKLFAIVPDGSGDVTSAKVLWTTEENVPDITSPACDGQLLITLTSSGTLTCFDAETGKKQWEHDFGMDFHSSPSIAGGRVYLFSKKGTALVVQASREFKELFRTEMQDAFDASPAFADGRIFLRGETNLWCIGASNAKVAEK